MSHISLMELTHFLYREVILSNLELYFIIIDLRWWILT